MAQLKYRADKYDADDTLYATKLKDKFGYLSQSLQDSFQEFTENLMSEKQINRYGLLQAIDDFKKINNDHDINTFYVMAFNFRPYQY